MEGEECVESDSDSDDDWDSEHEDVKEEQHPFAPKASSVVEHGILLDCSTRSLKTTATLQYWIIGYV